MGRTWCRDPEKLHPALRVKSDAVIRDVNGHLPHGYRLAYVETWRDPKVQAQLVKDGVSKTYHSKHAKVPAEAADLQFQRLNTVKDEWRFVDWRNIPANWIAWLDSSKRAHNVARKGLDWDHPHCELALADKLRWQMKRIVGRK